MIRNHKFNTGWWGDPVGIVHDPTFFSLDAAKQREPAGTLHLGGVLFTIGSDSTTAGPHRRRIHSDRHSDTIFAESNKVGSTTSMDRLDFHFADQRNFKIEVEELAMFTHERFQHIPDCTGSPNKRTLRFVGKQTYL